MTAKDDARASGGGTSGAAPDVVAEPVAVAAIQIVVDGRGDAEDARAETEDDDALLLTEAAVLYGIPLPRLRRLAHQGALAGAFKAKIGGRDHWHVPPSAVEALHDAHVERAQLVRSSRNATGELVALLGPLEILIEDLADDRAKVFALVEERHQLQVDREEARVAAARAEAALEAERAEATRLQRRVARLAEELAAVRAHASDAVRAAEAATDALARSKAEVERLRTHAERERLRREAITADAEAAAESGRRRRRLRRER